MVDENSWPNEPLHGEVDCIRCDDTIAGDPSENLSLTFDHEAGAVYVCGDCEEVVRERDVV